MISIHFEAKQDCQQLFEKITYYLNRYNTIGLKGTIEVSSEGILEIDYSDEDTFNNSFHPLLVSILTQHVIETKEETWMNEIIETIFFFTDEEEKTQILEIARSILEGDRKDIPNITPFFQRDAYIYNAFSASIEQETNFYYEPFLTFRLKDYGEMLIDCVEIAIDEYLLEQEYQNMLENFRYFLQNEKPKCEAVHLVYDGSFTFLNEFYLPIPKSVLANNLVDHLVFEEDLDIEDMVISPLVSLAPKMVHVYSDEYDHGVILTIQAIFQERATLEPLRSFSKKSQLM